MTFFGPSMTEKIFGELPVTVGGRGPSDALFLLYTYACVCEALALTEPERGVGL